MLFILLQTVAYVLRWAKLLSKMLPCTLYCIMYGGLLEYQGSPRNTHTTDFFSEFTQSTVKYSLFACLVFSVDHKGSFFEVILTPIYSFYSYIALQLGFKFDFMLSEEM